MTTPSTRPLEPNAPRQPGAARLLADLGGTNARFAWQAGPGAPLRELRVLAAADFPSVLDAAEHYLDGLAPAHARPVHAALGIANPVDGDRVRMTNHAWSFSIAQLREALGLERLVVINDFEALARALPLLQPHETRALSPGSGLAGSRAPIGLIGPGTGLGVGALVPVAPGRWRALATEGGHVSLATHDAREDAVLACLRQRFGHVSAERVVSGPGLVNLHQALCAIDGVPAASALAARDLTSDPPRADLDAARVEEVIGLFLGFLGSTAGNLALTLGARGGVYIAGGIVPRLSPQRVARSSLQARFVGKGRFEPWLQDIALRLIVSAESPALRGAALALDDPTG